jgi:hypothetical protein
MAGSAREDALRPAMTSGVKPSAYPPVSQSLPRRGGLMTETTMRMLIPCTIAMLWAVTAHAQAPAQPDNYESWPLLQAEFPSTGGGGIIIKGYDPVITGGKCVTDFSAHTPDGKAYYNVVEFEIVDVAGGKLCTNGKWRAKDGSANGTTPFRVFIKDGVRRASPQ